MTNNGARSRQLLLRVFRDPKSLEDLKIEEWELLIRSARESKLLAALSEKITLSSLEKQLPEKVVENLQGAKHLVRYRKRLALWELNRLSYALSELKIDTVVLKGAAYLLRELPMSVGRTLSDVDILVAKKDIARVEKHLLVSGWVASGQLDEYDEYFYRTWMHEIPPLRHQTRLVELDIHHAILPLTNRLSPNTESLLSEAIQIEGSLYKVLSPYDMVLHSSVHLFCDAELNASDFRDLVDLHELLTFFSAQETNFWNQLIQRSKELGLQRPLYYVLYFTHKLLKTAVPESILVNYQGRPSYIIRLLMDYFVPFTILPEHPDYPERKIAFMRWILFLRSHLLRMPLTLLIPHLFKKFRKRYGLFTD